MLGQCAQLSELRRREGHSRSCSLCPGPSGCCFKESVPLRSKRSFPRVSGPGLPQPVTHSKCFCVCVTGSSVCSGNGSWVISYPEEGAKDFQKCREPSRDARPQRRLAPGISKLASPASRGVCALAPDARPAPGGLPVNQSCRTRGSWDRTPPIFGPLGSPGWHKLRIPVLCVFWLWVLAHHERNT